MSDPMGNLVIQTALGVALLLMDTCGEAEKAHAATIISAVEDIKDALVSQANLADAAALGTMTHGEHDA